MICKKCELEKGENMYYKYNINQDIFIFDICRSCCDLIKHNDEFKIYRKSWKSKISYTQMNLIPRRNKRLVILNEDVRNCVKSINSLKNKLVKFKSKWDKKDDLNVYLRKRRDENPLFKMSCNIRNLIKSTLSRKKHSKKSKTRDILGCSYPEFKLYLESKFEPWMTWNNYGVYTGKKNEGWEIDHVVPVFSADTESRLIELNHYTNLQPLCSFQNRGMKRVLDKRSIDVVNGKK